MLVYNNYFHRCPWQRHAAFISLHEFSLFISVEIRKADWYHCVTPHAAKTMAYAGQG